MTAEVENAPVAEASAPAVEKKPKKEAAAKKAKVPAAAPSHPKTSEMVDAAISNLKERGGSSLLAMKKYIATTYKVDSLKIATYIKKYLKTAVESGHLIQTKGKGATGSFKLSTKAVAKPKKVVKPNVDGTAAPKKKAPSAEKTKKKATSSASVTKKTPISKKIEKKKADKVAAVAAKKAGSVKSKNLKQPRTVEKKSSKAGALKVKKPAVKKVAAKK